MNNNIDSVSEAVFARVCQFNALHRIDNFEEKNSLYLENYPSLIIFISNFLKVYPSASDHEALYKYVSEVVTQLNKSTQLSVSLVYGLTSTMYALYSCSGIDGLYTKLYIQLNELYEKLLTAEIDRFKAFYRSGQLTENDYDIINGLAGNLAFLLLDPNQGKHLALAKRILTLFVNSVLQMQLSKKNALVLREKNNGSEIAYYNLGMSHGLSGLLSALSAAACKGITFPIN